MLSKEVKLRRAINRNWKAGYRADQKQTRKLSGKAAFVRLVHRALRMGISQRMLLSSPSCAERYGWSAAAVARVNRTADAAAAVLDTQTVARRFVQTQRMLREIGIT